MMQNMESGLYDMEDRFHMVTELGFNLIQSHRPFARLELLKKSSVIENASADSF